MLEIGRIVCVWCGSDGGGAAAAVAAAAAMMQHRNIPTQWHLRHMKMKILILNLKKVLVVLNMACYRKQKQVNTENK